MIRRLPHRALAGAIAAALLGASAGPARAVPRPELAALAGQTFGATSAPDHGGLSLSLAALWPVDWRLGDRVVLGMAVSADDLGSELGQLRDSHDGTALGATQLRQRSVYALEWRMDARAHQRLGATPYASGTWGFSRVLDGHLGTRLRSVGSTGFSLGGGLGWPIGGAGTLGIALRYHRLFNDVVGRYLSAGVDWGWRAGH